MTETTTPAREAFLAGERLEDVALFLATDYVDDDRLAGYGEAVDDGVVIVVDGERGRNAFKAATGTDAMGFARAAMEHEGLIDGDLTGGTCPEEPPADDEVTEGDDEHGVQFIFAFAEAQNEEVGGIYADGDVIHAYAQCRCGTAYSDRWTI